MVLLAKPSKLPRVPKAEVEIILNRACLGLLPGKEGMQHFDVGQKVKVGEEVARQLIEMCGSGYYIDPADDASVDKEFTLTKERMLPIQCRVEQIRARAAEKSEEEAFARASRRALIEKYGT